MADLELLTLILEIMSKEKTKVQESTNPPLLIADVSKSVCDHNKHGSRIVFGERRCAKCGALFGRM